jgi:molybdopterin-containing oxidoreductase family iron-sulfur binding subunit
MSSMNHGYWRSLRQLEQQTAAAEDREGAPLEFPESAVDATTSDPMSRRNFVQVMGASMALAGVAGAGCKRWDKDEIVPLARRPEDQIPGIPSFYATSWDFRGSAQALVATAYEGRPIKVDGNPDHPFAGGGVVDGTETHGGSSAFAQASVLNLYDPERSRSVLRDAHGATFGDFVKWLAASQLKGPRVRILSEACSSPTVRRLRDELVASGAQWHEWEAVSQDNVRAGMKLAFGQPVRPIARLAEARTIVALDCDLFVEHPAALRYNRDWARSRRFGAAGPASVGAGLMSRLYAIESSFTTTGAVADHRLPLRSRAIGTFVGALAAKLGVQLGAAPTGAKLTEEAKIKHFLEVLAEELDDNKQHGVVLVAGSRQPPAVHAMVAKINEHLGGVVDYYPDPDPTRLDHAESIAELVKALDGGEVDYLVTIGGNPVFDAPADLDFATAMTKVKKGTVHLSEYEDETSAKSTWHVPRAHYLEAWGDALTWDGTHTLAQPLILPMYGGISTIELLTLILGGDAAAGVTDPDAMKSVRKTFDDRGASVSWNAAVEAGFVRDSAPAPLRGLAAGNLPVGDFFDPGPSSGTGSVEVVFVPSTQTWDGRFANNAWLQETPDFMSKITWDNYALVAPSSPYANDTIIRIQVGERKVELACQTMPGQAKDSIAVVLGGGRTAAGRVGGKGKKTVGVDVYPIRTTAALDIVADAKVTATGRAYQLASVQEHWDIREGIPGSKKDMAQKGISDRLFDLVREATLDEANAPGYHAEHEHHFPTLSLFDEKQYPEDRVHRWGMTIDLGSCTGCNACSVACQAENNVPVVGRDNVIRNREMHWIRIDRYFSGSPEDPQVVHQPLACVHCENAPCEQVCPVGATIHSSEGLNEMTYNRCIGTRYCLNNCSYRVRRFNFFDYNKEAKEARNKVRRLLFNPEVTIRHRGVMEKCTYCVQRIQNKKIEAKNLRTNVISDGEITTACQAACPTEAIVFGDLNDPDSRVRRIQSTDPRQYEMLGELNTKPRTHHLARVRNPNPKLESHGNRGHH